MGELVSSAVSGLFPEIEPRASGMLRLDATHSMYWEESGDPAGIPVVFLHGGPGAGSTPKHRRFFDPGAYRIIVYDQRGAGRSTPLGEVRDNTTPHLVADLETLRQRLNAERWLVFGGSWSVYEGSCSTLRPDPETLAYFAGDGVALGLARIEAHYFIHDIFLPENSLLANARRLRGIPGVIVQGRYDMVCPPVSAHELYRAWPQAEYRIVPDAGHSVWEPGILAALVDATERFKRTLSFAE